MQDGRFAWEARLATPASAVALLRPSFVDLVHEELRVIYLDARMRPLRLRATPGTSASHVDVPIREIMAEALAIDAGALILAHNHPGGDPTPSAADKSVTRRLAEVAAALDIQLADHLVFAGDTVASFRAMGLL